MLPASEVTGVIKALNTLLQDGGRQERLGDPKRAGDVLKELGLPGGVAQEVLFFLERCRGRSSPGGVAQPGNAGGAPKADDTVANTQLEAFHHIRSSYRVAIGMSVVMFLMGAVMLMTAFSRAVTEQVLSQGTLAIGGMALADFAILFFRQPWKDVAINLSNSQRARVLATSYLVGLALIKSKDAEGLQQLADLTARSVELLRDGGARPPPAGRHDSPPDYPREATG